VHNIFGRYYLAAVIPFRKMGVRKLVSTALVEQRF
jgi:hypothetical protein